MKGIIFYFSTTGNTKLACQYIKSNIKDVEFELFDITKANAPNLSDYDIVGFATYCDFWAPGKLMREFIANLSPVASIPAFVFNTFGRINGNALSLLAKAVVEAGFSLIEAHALHVPENYPPMIKAGMTFDDSPNTGETEEFNAFISSINEKAVKIINNESVEEKIVKSKIGFTLGRASVIALNANSMGKKELHEDKCNGCAICSKVCPYDAIAMVNDNPEFNEAKCNSCFSCYNKCPSFAIYTKKLDCVGHYPKPHAKLINKFKESRS